MVILKAINRLLISLAAGIYKIVSYVYQAFLVLAETNIFTEDQYENITNKVYIILGVVMLFIISYNILTFIIDPDKNKGGTAIEKVLKNTIFSFILIVLCPTLFSLAFDVQNAILNSGTISNFFTLNGTSTASNTITIKNGGMAMAAYTFSSFFDASDNSSVTAIEKARDDAIANNNFKAFKDFDDDIANDKMDFHFIIALIAGGYLCYVIVSFCFDLAVRVIKLAFYQIIAPVTISCKILPQNEKIFTNWWKAVSKTYLSVFIRVIVINLAIYLLTLFIAGDLFKSACISGGSNQCSTGIITIGRALVILGIVTFMRQAPKLIDEVFGLGMGDMKLGIKDKLKEGGFFAAGAALGTAVATRGNVYSTLRAARGGWNSDNFHSIGSEVQRRREFLQARERGATRGSILMNRLRDFVGLDTTADAAVRSVENAPQDVMNNTGERIEFIDSRTGQTTFLETNQVYGIDKQLSEDLEAQKTRNVGEMSSYNEQLRIFDKKIASGTSRIQHKSSLKSEAEGKIDEKGSKRKGTIHYIDANTGLDTTFTGTYAQIEEFVNKDLTPEQRESINLNQLRDDMIHEYLRDELAATGDNKVKQLTRSGFESIINNGGKYEYLYYDTDGAGNRIERQATISVERDGDGYRVTQILDNGSTVDLSTGREVYDVIGEIDKLAKSSNNVYADKKQYVEEYYINPLKSQNEAIENVVKQANEQREELLAEHEQRGREAAKKYTSSNKPK